MVLKDVGERDAKRGNHPDESLKYGDGMLSHISTLSNLVYSGDASSIACAQCTHDAMMRNIISRAYWLKTNIDAPVYCDFVR